MSELIRNKDLAKRLDDLSTNTRIPKSKLVDEAIEMLLAKHKNNI